MIKRLMYIFLLLIFTSRLSVAKPCGNTTLLPIKSVELSLISEPVFYNVIDTTRVKNKNVEAEEKKKIKEIAKARRQAKPEKLGAVPQPIDTLNSKVKIKVTRQRRPEGLERPPEIPRRNNN